MDLNPSNLKDGCLLTLRYFGIFRYPLTLQEIHRFNRTSASVQETQKALDDLLNHAKIYKSGGYFMPESKEEWVLERTKGNARAFHLLDKSGKYVSVIASCPFVRGIAISGSLSKFYASEKTDIDYFIITAADRLWIARTLLHLFKKLTFLTGHQHYFCMNYFVDTKSLKITHPNLYTSIEIATLLPVYNSKIIQQFVDENEWFREYLPNHPGLVNFKYLLQNKRLLVKKSLEWIIDLMFPAKLNKALMNLTDWKWKRKWKHYGYPEMDYDRAFLTELHISKNHPVDYEKKVLTSMSQIQVPIPPNI